MLQPAVRLGTVFAARKKYARLPAIIELPVRMIYFAVKTDLKPISSQPKLASLL